MLCAVQLYSKKPTNKLHVQLTMGKDEMVQRILPIDALTSATPISNKFRCTLQVTLFDQVLLILHNRIRIN